MRASSVRAAAHAGVPSDELCKSCEYPADTAVRETTQPTPAGLSPASASPPPAHPSNRLVARLNASWRITDGPLQWILQRRKGNPVHAWRQLGSFTWRSPSNRYAFDTDCLDETVLTRPCVQDDRTML